MLNLRQYQADGIGGIREVSKTYKKLVYVLPTGGGKTLVCAYVALSALQKQKRVMILTHRNNLLDQMTRKFTEIGLPHGRVASGRSRTRDLVQVCSVQTLVKRLNHIEAPDIILVDEGHHLVQGTQWGKVIEHFPNALVIGVTATPCRLDGKGLGAGYGGYYETMVLGPDIQTLISEGYLSRPATYRPPSDIDLTGVKITAGDYNLKELTARKNKSHIVGDSIEHYEKLAEGKPAIVFEISVEGAKETAEKFRKAGYNFIAIDGNQDKRFIRGTIDALAAGKIQGVVSCDLISEGTDVPVVEVGIFLRPTQSLSLYMQQAGRILRPCAGKERAILIDPVGNSLTHGLVEQPREWSLAGFPKKKRGEKTEAGEKITQCQTCFFVYPKELAACPECNAIKTISRRELEQIEGELVLAQMEIKKQEERREIGKARTLEELREIGKARGYKAGWAEIIYNARQKKGVV